MSETKPKAARKVAPSNINAQLPGQGQRKALLKRLDEENPDFVHMYQRPEIMHKDNPYEWELEAKGQEVVHNADGGVEHHLGDPVVRVNRKDQAAAQKQESAFSREQVESVVKRQRSTVTRQKKQQIEIEDKQ